MTLLLETDHALPLIQIHVSLATGSQVDPPGKEGLTRLALRLMRRTGHGLGAEALDERFDGIGSSLVSEVTITSAGLSGSVISRSLDEFVELMRGVLCAPSLDEAEFERLKRETLAELIEQQDSDQFLVQRWFRRRFFADHIYGRGTTGTPLTLAAISIDDVRAYYAQYVVRNNLTFGFAGDITEAGAIAVRDQVWKDLPAGETSVDNVGEPTQPPGRHLVVVDKPERTQTQILIGCLGTHPLDGDHVALSVANTAFGGTFTARLMQAVRVQRGWSYGAYSSLPYDRQRQAFSMWCFPAATDASACVALELSMLEEFVSKGLTQAELDYAKRYLINSNVFNTDTAVKRLAQKLDELVSALPANYHANFSDEVSKLTLEEVNSAIATRLSARDLLLVVVGTEAEIGPGIKAAIPDLTSYDVIPFDAD